MRELAEMQWHAPLAFTKGCPVMRIPSTGLGRLVEAFETRLFDLATDPGQTNPIDDGDVEARMIAALEGALASHLPRHRSNTNGWVSPRRSAARPSMPGDTEAIVHDGRHFERVLWRSRRGMLELDLLLVDFARCRYRALDPADQRAYQELLGFDDWDDLRLAATALRPLRRAPRVSPEFSV